MSRTKRIAAPSCTLALALLIGVGSPCRGAAQNDPSEPSAELALETAPSAASPPYEESRVRSAGAGTPAPDALPAASPEDVGLAPWLPDRLDEILRDAIAHGATPGAALAVGRRGRLVVSAGYGRLDWDRRSPSVTDSTIYDLASLTKVVATTTAAMLLVEEGRLDLDAPIHHWLSRWPSWGFQGRITVRHLLEHTSGLPAGTRLWRREDGPHDFVLSLSELPLRSIPGTVEHYSDLGMILLGFVVERAAGVSLDVLARERIFEPLAMRDSDFQPLLRGRPISRIAPTEVFRGELLRGIVHDPNAWTLGGVAGHAGLFSSARDLASFAAALLWETPDPLVCRTVVRRFATQESRMQRFALGWETPFRWTRWGDYFSRDAVGHTGYTGTGIWIDPGQDLFVVLLTNRVNPTARNQKHLALRREVHRAVRDAILDYGPRGGWLTSEEGARFVAEGVGEGGRACREEEDPLERFRRLLPVLRAATRAAAP